MTPHSGFLYSEGHDEPPGKKCINDLIIKEWIYCEQDEMQEGSNFFALWEKFIIRKNPGYKCIRHELCIHPYNDWKGVNEAVRLSALLVLRREQDLDNYQIPE